MSVVSKGKIKTVTIGAAECPVYLVTRTPSGAPPSVKDGVGLSPKAASIDAGDHHGPRPKQNTNASAAMMGEVHVRNSRSTCAGHVQC